MKKTEKLLSAALLLALIAIGTLVAESNEFDVTQSDVPHAVLAAFTQKYPSTQPSEWEVQEENGQLVFAAEIGMNKEAEFKPDGTFVREE